MTPSTEAAVADLVRTFPRERLVVADPERLEATTIHEFVDALVPTD